MLRRVTLVTRLQINEKEVNILKKLLAVVLVLSVALCGCGNLAKQNVSNTGNEETIESLAWKYFTDISGDVIALEHKDIKNLELTYALGWNFDAEGYRTIRQGDIVGSCTVTEVASSYHVIYEDGAFYGTYSKGDGLPVVICNGNGYWVECNDTISGILQISGDSVVFFPYDKPGKNFLFLCIREEGNEEVFANTSHIHINDDKEVKVQPIGIVLHFYDGDIISEIPGLETGENLNPQYYEAEILFDGISFSALSDGEDAEIFGTRARGSIESYDSISVLSSLGSGTIPEGPFL